MKRKHKIILVRLALSLVLTLVFSFLPKPESILINICIFAMPYFVTTYFGKL